MMETIAAFARRRGVCRRTVEKWRTRGLVVMVGDRVDVERSERALAERPQRYRGGEIGGNLRRNGNGHASEEPATLGEALLKKERAIAELRQVEADLATKRVVLIEDVVRQMAGTMALVRAHLLRLDRTISSRAASCASP